MNSRTLTLATTLTVAGIGLTGIGVANALPTTTPATSAAVAPAAIEAPADNTAAIAAAVAEKMHAEAAYLAEISANMQAQAAAEAEAAAAAAATTTGGAASDVAAWASSDKAMAVKFCESTNNYSTNTGNGYYGAWQFDLPSWHANGGGAFAERPDLAPAWAQDQVAFNYYQVAGWGPWECA